MVLAEMVAEGNFMHEYRRFVQRELDARGWEPRELVRRSGVNRQLIWKILHDDRDYLGQMPDDSTLEAIASGFGIPTDRVRTAAARSLAGYTDDGQPISTDLSDISIDALLTEVRRRVADDPHRVIPPADEAEHRSMLDMLGTAQEPGAGRDENGHKRHQLGGR